MQDKKIGLMVYLCRWITARNSGKLARKGFRVAVPLETNGALEGHRQTNPKRWQREGGKTQAVRRGQWKNETVGLLKQEGVGPKLNSSAQSKPRGTVGRRATGLKKEEASRAARRKLLAAIFL
jgi:hypothetical protein